MEAAWYNSVVFSEDLPGPAGSASLGNLSEMQILGPHPIPTESKTLETGLRELLQAVGQSESLGPSPTSSSAA